MAAHKKHNLPDNIIYSPEVIEFVTIANEYCLLLEGLNELSREEFIEQSYKLLTLLHLKAIVLPKPANVSDAETETFMNEADWHFIDQGISTKLGSLETFNELVEPARPNVPLELSLSECMTDTYQDLKDFTQLYQFGNEEAITIGLWECKTNFEQIWGPRIIIVMKEFHNLLYSDTEINDETDNTENLEQNNDNWLDDRF
jgi:hypothetical protein